MANFVTIKVSSKAAHQEITTMIMIMIIMVITIMVMVMVYGNGNIVKK